MIGSSSTSVLPAVTGATGVLPDLSPNTGIRHSVNRHATIYEGTKNFWRTRTNVDLTFVEHVDLAIIEIISFNPDSHKEGPRIYVDAKRLYGLLDETTIEEKVSAKREELVRQRKRVPGEELRKGVIHSLANAYILARIALQDDAEPDAFGIVLQPSEGDKVDKETKQLKFIIPKPENIHEIVIHRLKKTRCVHTFVLK